ncbi:hypothetical protein BLNAU_8468 [Blattamonas nauphoetae]|uniref:Phospholipid/glycerol acyltransferase domain-containing protein n=1 Tax=Blattamonas nauphoetae TaxID=2049346 RepID=A0ABQ9XYQ0_9EUKA|nr:hypothetical protein BLNAU_8468 [Blattamonas nauphoetae]
MEKFTKFSDPTTGINPFLPRSAGTKGSKIGQSALKIGPIGYIRFILKAPFVLITLLLWFILSLLFKITPLGGLIDVVFSKLLLFFFGFWKITSKKAANTRGSPPGYEQEKRGEYPKNDTLILSNHGSFIDTLYLISKYHPTFAFIANDYDVIPDNVTIQTKSGLSALFCDYRNKPLKVSDGITLQEKLHATTKKIAGPFVVYFEGTTTNGRSILQPIYSAFKGCQPSSVLALAFSYSDATECTFTTQTPFAFFISLLSQSGHQLTVAESVPFAKNSKETADVNFDLVLNHLRLMMCDAARAIPAEINIEMKKKMEAYLEEELKNKIKC